MNGYKRRAMLWWSDCALMCLHSAQLDVVENGGDRRQPPRYLDPDGRQKVPRSDGRQKARKVDKVSRRMFPMTFVLFNIVYWILYSVPFDGFGGV